MDYLDLELIIVLIILYTIGVHIFVWKSWRFAILFYAIIISAIAGISYGIIIQGVDGFGIILIPVFGVFTIFVTSMIHLLIYLLTIKPRKKFYLYQLSSNYFSRTGSKSLNDLFNDIKNLLELRKNNGSLVGISIFIWLVVFMSTINWNIRIFDSLSGIDDSITLFLYSLYALTILILIYICVVGIYKSYSCTYIYKGLLDLKQKYTGNNPNIQIKPILKILQDINKYLEISAENIGDSNLRENQLTNFAIFFLEKPLGSSEKGIVTNFLHDILNSINFDEFPDLLQEIESVRKKLDPIHFK